MKIPIMYELHGKKILIVGGDMKAYLQAKLLCNTGADISVVSKSYCTHFEKLSKIKLYKEVLTHTNLNKDYFSNKDIVIIATNNPYLNKKIYTYCKNNKIISTTLDNSTFSHFELMESIDKNGLLLGISTHTNNPCFEAEILQHLIQTIDDETFLRLSMLIDERRLLNGLTKRK